LFDINKRIQCLLVGSVIEDVQVNAYL